MTIDEPEISDELRAPFPYFGGKRRVAPLVWSRLGAVHTYNEPFAGSLAVLLGRPDQPRVETVNDLDCYLANFWRALQLDPDQVAYHADSPVNEADLHARHRWLVEVARANAEKCMTDPDYFDAKIAGWWVWGQCLWIGSDWCATNHRSQGDNPYESAKRPKLRERGSDGVATHERNGRGTAHQKRRPHLSGEQGVTIPRKRMVNPGHGQGAGVHSQRASGRRWQGGGERGGGSGVHAVGLHRTKPVLSDGVGRGVARALPTLADLLNGGEEVMPHTRGLYDYLHRLSARMRRVRVCCGDWKRVLTPSVTTYIGTCGVFLDPPYAHELRERCYSEDHDVSAEVGTWAREHGDDPNFRIALCGYEGEHHMPDTWECVPWKAHGGYSRSERGVANRDRERIWFSPHCLKADLPLFAGLHP